MFKNYKDSLFNDKIILRSQQIIRSKHHRVYTEEVNKIALSSNDDKRIQTFDKVTTYPYGTNVFAVCKNEMLLKNKVMSDQVKHRLETDDYLSAVMDHSKNLRRNIVIYNDKLKSINSKLSYVYMYTFHMTVNAKKDLESLKTEINEFKSDHAMFKFF